MYIFYALIAAAVISILIALSTLSKEKRPDDFNFSDESPAAFLSSNDDLDDIPTATDFSILQDTIIHKKDPKKKQKEEPQTGTASMRTVSATEPEPAESEDEGPGPQKSKGNPSAALQQKNEKLEKLLTEKNQVLTDSQKSLNVQLEKSNSYDKIKKVLESEIQLLRKDKKAMKDELNALKKSVNSSGEKMQSLETTLSSIRNLLIEKEQENKKLKKAIQSQSGEEDPALKRKKPVFASDDESMHKKIVNLMNQHENPDPDALLPKFGASQIDEDSTLIDDTPNISFKDMTITSLEHSSLAKKDNPVRKNIPVDENAQIEDNTYSLSKTKRPQTKQDVDQSQSNNYHGSGFETFQSQPNEPEEDPNEGLFDTSYGDTAHGAHQGNLGQESGEDVYDLNLSGSYSSEELDLTRPGASYSDMDESTLDLSNPSEIDLESYGREIDESIKKSQREQKPKKQKEEKENQD